jgi:hypothetical protein
MLSKVIQIIKVVAIVGIFVFIILQITAGSKGLFSGIFSSITTGISDGFSGLSGLLLGIPRQGVLN